MYFYLVLLTTLPYRQPARLGSAVLQCMCHTGCTDTHNPTNITFQVMSPDQRGGSYPNYSTCGPGSCSIFETSLESYPKILINTFQAFAQELFNNIQKRFQKCGTDVTVNSVSHLLDPQFILHEFIGAYKSAREGVSQISDSGLVGRRRAE